MPTLPPSVQRFTLSNGLQVYLRQDHRAPLVSAQLWYHVGGSHEADGQTGLSHLLEHLMFEGSSKLAPGEYSTLMTRIGAEPNAFTTHDATVYPLTLPANRLEIGLEAMADAMASATLDAPPFERERNVVIAERRNRVDNNPLGLAFERHALLAHGNSRYAHPALGHLNDLQQLTEAHARAWHQAWYRPNNATLAVAGAIDLAHLQRLVERHFAAIAPASLPPAPIPRADTSLAQRSQTLRQRGLRNGVLLSFNVPSQCTATHVAQTQALSLIPDLLSEGRGARLKHQLVYQTPLLQALTCRYDPLQRGDTLLNLYAYTADATSPQAAAERLFAEFEELGRTAPTPEELERAKARLRARQVFARDDIADQAHAIGKRAAIGLDPTLMDHEQQAVDSVDAEQVRQAAAQFLTAQRGALTFMHAEEKSDE